MQAIFRSISFRALPRAALASVLLAAFALSGCEKADPLEAIRKQQAAGDYKSTIEPLRKLLAERENDAETNYLYGRALAFTEPNLAVWALRKAMDDPEWLVPAGLQLAYLSLAGFDFNETIKICGRILEHDPDNARVYLMRANAHAHSRRNPELALADAKRALEIDRDEIGAYEPMILALLALERVDEAEAALAEAGGRIRDLGMKEGVAAWHCATTAIFEKESGKLDKARAAWPVCLEAHPSDLDVVSSAVAFYDGQGEMARSIEILRTALAGAPDTQFFRLSLAQHLQAAGDAAEGEAILREATNTDQPELAIAAWMDLARYRQDLGDYTASADAFERALELSQEAGTETPQYLFGYADALVLAERFDRALEVAEELPVPAHRHLIRGRVAQERRQAAAALAEFDEALRLWPDNPWARYYAALAAEETGDFERAIEEYRNAIRINPAATDARTRGAALLLASGAPGSANTILRTSIEGVPLDLDGLMLGMRVSGAMGNTTGISEFLTLIEASYPAWAGRGLAVAAEALARRNGPETALGMLAKAPDVDYEDPRYAPALRALVLYSHQAGRAAAARVALAKILAAQPDASALQEIHALDLELSGAPAEAVAAAYSRAIELGPGNALALAGLGRLTAKNDPEAALGYFDRATAANPSDPAPALEAARILIAQGKTAQAEQRLDALLVEHPFAFEAAAEIVRIDLAKGEPSARTVDRAYRAARFGGGADALDVLSRVYTLRNEPDLAERAAKQARTLREPKAADG